MAGSSRSVYTQNTPVVASAQRFWRQQRRNSPFLACGSRCELATSAPFVSTNTSATFAPVCAIAIMRMGKTGGLWRSQSNGACRASPDRFFQQPQSSPCDANSKSCAAPGEVPCEQRSPGRERRIDLKEAREGALQNQLDLQRRMWKQCRATGDRVASILGRIASCVEQPDAAILRESAAPQSAIADDRSVQEKPPDG